MLNSIKKNCSLFIILFSIGFNEHCNSINQRQSNHESLTSQELEIAALKTGKEIVTYLKKNLNLKKVSVVVLKIKNETQNEIKQSIFEETLVTTLLKNKIYTYYDKRDFRMRNIGCNQGGGLESPVIKSFGYLIRTTNKERKFKNDEIKYVEQVLEIELINIHTLETVFATREVFHKER